MRGWSNGTVAIKENNVARKTEQDKREERHGDAVRDVARSNRGHSGDIVAADSIDAVAAHQAVQEDADQAELSGDAPADGVVDKFAAADGPTNDEVEAANKARLAKGEDPVAAASEDVLPTPDPNYEGVEGVGEDTMAIRQSAVDRVIDGEIVRSAEQPSTMGTTRDSAAANIKE